MSIQRSFNDRSLRSIIHGHMPGRTAGLPQRIVDRALNSATKALPRLANLFYSYFSGRASLLGGQGLKDTNVRPGKLSVFPEPDQQDALVAQKVRRPAILRNR